MNSSETHKSFPMPPILQQIGVELKRAERYRIFMSLVAVDLSFTEQLLGEEAPGFIERVSELTQSNIRVCDVASIVGESCLVMLLPETSRQGAEISGRRLAEMIQGELSHVSKQEVHDVIPMEMASYPDAAGTKSVADFLETLTAKLEN
jgi:hypothetical protein